jgi:branched-chain amino acid transport system ATP-binding protein
VTATEDLVTPGDADARPPILELDDIRAAYGAIEVVHGVSLAVPAGGVLALLGPNGAGKTTVIGVASGLLSPTAGAVRLAGHDVTGVGASDLARAGVCTVPEGRGIFPNLTVSENLLMATYSGVDRRRLEESAYSHFPRLGERRNQLVGTMSGGEQQMLAMARALATDPALLLLDELSMGLAPRIVSELYEQVAGVAASGVSVLVVEQFARSVLGVADRAVVMTHGVVRWSGPAGDLDDDVLTTTYLGGP